MRTTFIPSTNDGLVSWSLNLVNKLSAQPGHFGVGPARLASLVASQAAYAQAQRATADGGKPATARRNAARAALLADVRAAVAVVRAQEDLTDAQQVQLGLRPPNPRRKAIPRPRVAPGISIRSVVGRRVSLRLVDRDGDRPRRPRDVAGAAIYLRIAEEPSLDPQQWRRLGNATRARHLVVLPANLTPGTKFWLSAAWYNARAQLGPASLPVGARMPFDGPIEMAA